jgi:glycosyltransferase involved in cell wall biosynthesis
LLDQIEALGPQDRSRIVLPGYIAEVDKAALISGAEAMLFISLYEGFGFPILEGQVCETPVLCAETSSLPEVAGNATLMVPADDTAAQAEAIQRLVNDTTLRTELIAKGKTNAKRFSWERTASQTLTTLLRAAG